MKKISSIYILFILFLSAHYSTPLHSDDLSEQASRMQKEGRTDDLLEIAPQLSESSFNLAFTHLLKSNEAESAVQLYENRLVQGNDDLTSLTYNILKLINADYLNEALSLTNNYLNLFDDTKVRLILYQLMNRGEFSAFFEIIKDFSSIDQRLFFSYIRHSKTIFKVEEIEGEIYTARAENIELFVFPDLSRDEPKLVYLVKNQNNSTTMYIKEFKSLWDFFSSDLLNAKYQCLKENDQVNELLKDVDPNKLIEFEVSGLKVTLK